MFDEDDFGPEEVLREEQVEEFLDSRRSIMSEPYPDPDWVEPEDYEDLPY